MAKDSSNNKLKKIIKSINKAAKGDYSEKLEKPAKGDEYEKLVAATNKLISGVRKKIRSQKNLKIAKQLQRVNRTLRIISECNQKIIRAKTEEDILSLIPETLLKFGNYHFIWIGYVEYDKEKSVKPVAFSGLSEKFFDKLKITWANNKFGQGPTGSSVRTGRYVICQNIKTDPLYAAWRERAVEWNYSSSVSLPLKDENKVFGVLNIYAAEAGEFNEDEIKLLEELADDISYGIIALRTKEKHEKAKKSLEETTAHNQFLASILELSSQPFAVRYPNGKLGTFNKAFSNLVGYNEEELNKLNWKELTPAEWRKIEDDKLSDLTCNSKPVRFEKEYIQKNGNRVPVELLVHKYCDHNGQLKYYYAFITDITERKKIEEALLYTQFSVDKARDAIFWVREDGGIAYVNEAACKSLEYTKEELLSLSLFDFDPKFTRSIWKEHWTKTRKLQSYIVETYHKTKSGRVFPVEVAINFMSFAGKEYHSAFARDISERKKSEEQLKLTQFSIDNSQVSVFQIDENGNIVYANKYASQVLGYSSDEILKLKIWDVNPEIKKENWKDYRDNISTQDKISIETKHVKKDRTEFPVEVQINFLKFDDKNISFSFAKDITERKLFEKELKLSESRLYEAQHLAHMGNWELNLRTKKVYWSDEVYRIFGYEPGQNEIDLEFVLSRLTPDDREHMIKLLDDAVHKKIPYSYDHTVILPNDKIRIVHSEGKVVWSAEGEALNIYGTVQDITERKKYENDIIAAKERAEDMSRLKSNFLANMSHELRTPLFGILGLSELLTHEITNPEQKDMIDAVYESSKRLSETLNLILDLSKIESNKLELNAVKFDIGVVSLNVINTFKEVAKKKGIYLKTNFNIPELKVRLDKRAYESILNNLINNAVKFTKSGGVTMKLSLEIIGDKNYVVLKVIDTGIGISEKDFEIIFDEFRQASEGMSRNFEGSGLGLNITKKFIEKMDGTISVKSELGKGTEFEVKLPIVKSDLKEFYEKKNNIEQKESIELDFIPSILLVDDDINVKSILTNYLSSKFRLLHVLNGDDAVNIVRKEKFDAILMDINLKGGMDGLKVTNEIRKIPGYENTPIIACTAFAMSGDKDEFLAAGCSHYIAKPFSKNEIISLLKEVFI